MAFFNQVMDLNLSTEDVAALETRTEGWIAGLQVAALSMQNRDDTRKHSFITTFTGSHRYILDYLAEEVLQQQEENASLPPLSGQEMLEYLEQANLFIVPLDDKRHWYRYHYLFADFLHNQLRQTQPDEISDLHRRAGDWYEQH